MGNHKSTVGESDKKNKSGLIIKTCTWSKDSHSLYDYESQKQIKKDVIPVSSTCNIVRVADEVKQDSQSENESQKDNLFQIKQNRGGYYFSQECMQQQNYDGLNKNSAWIVVRSLQNLLKNKTQGFQLSANDYIKLGRVRFRVKELSIKNQNTTDKSSANDTSDTKEYLGENKESCRICLADTYTKKNRFIQPCNCAGTVAYVHEECLQQWLKSKIHCKETPIHSYYSMKNLECELCKFKYTDENSFVGKNFESVLIQKPNCPYLMLELLSKEKSIVRAIQLIKFEKVSQIVLGRGSDSDIRISDISVSREHAIIKLENNKFMIEDQKSKFGTLILIQRPIELSPSFNKIEVQIGRSICYFQIKKQSNFLTACCSGKGSKKNDVINSTVISKATQAEFMENDARINVSNQYMQDEEQKNQFEQSSPLRQNRVNGNGAMNVSPARVPQRGGAIGTRQNLPDTMQHIFATNHQIQQPQTVEDLQRMEEIQINIENENNIQSNNTHNNIENPENENQESRVNQVPTFLQNNQFQQNNVSDKRK
ncbi:hypothetical protein ABPG74_005798 [Tetrahymena malaccensis]